MEQDKTHWISSFVNWGHLLIASVGLSIAIGGSLMLLERRLTILEERQQANIKRIADAELMLSRTDIEQEKKFEELRKELVKKLDLIGADIVILKVSFAITNSKRNQ